MLLPVHQAPAILLRIDVTYTVVSEIANKQEYSFAAFGMQINSDDISLLSRARQLLCKFMFKYRHKRLAHMLKFHFNTINLFHNKSSFS